MACGNNARGRLERCELWGNVDGGVLALAGSNLALVACTLRDHGVRDEYLCMQSQLSREL